MNEWAFYTSENEWMGVLYKWKWMNERFIQVKINGRIQTSDNKWWMHKYFRQV